MVARDISLALAVKELHEGTTTERLMLMMCICGRIYIWAAYILIMMIDDNDMLYLSLDTLFPFAYHKSIKKNCCANHPLTNNWGIPVLAHPGLGNSMVTLRERRGCRGYTHAQVFEEDVTNQKRPRANTSTCHGKVKLPIKTH